MNSKLSDIKIALVHDHLFERGGAERVLEALHEIFPKAPVYTAYYVEDKFHGLYEGWDIKQSFLRKVPCLSKLSSKSWFRTSLLFFYPFIFSRLDLTQYDLVISSTNNGQAKGVKVGKNGYHISYIHTPPKRVWGILPVYGLRKFLVKFLRRYDYKFSKMPDILIANSLNVQNRIKKFYKRDSLVINPPVLQKKLREWSSGYEKEDYFVMGGRLDEFKGVSMVAKILDKHGYKMKIFGRGEDQRNLGNLSANIEYLGYLNEEKKAEVLAKAKAFIMWNEEDFGIGMVESLACGTPVIAYGKGGALEIVENKKNGILFKDQSEVGLIEAVEKISKLSMDLEYIRISAEKFDKEHFIKNIKKNI